MPAVYFNLDLTLTRMERPFDALAVEVLQHADVPDPEIDPTKHSNLFFDRFLELEDDPLVGSYAAYFDDITTDVDVSAEEAADLQKQLEVDAVRPAVADLPGLVETVGAEHAVGVLTSGLPDLQRAKLEKLGIADSLDDVVISYERDATKASGDLFAAAEAAADAETFVYVSNHDSDLEAAEAAGWKTIPADATELADGPLERISDAL
ncbi:HAD-IA family hydrolase [Halostella pelagica]|uniref:HAD-IA family hydrolase n=1 Tax=Halostella pelagica TaxID=2583824 RepID=UPI001081AF7A|nr:HAD-IA family hydrolase [Halostella pelagica]